MAGIGIGGMLAGLGAGLGQYADYALKQKQQQANELYQQVQLAMLRSKLQQEQGDQAIASTPFDLGAPGASGGVGGGLGAAAGPAAGGMPGAAPTGAPSLGGGMRAGGAMTGNSTGMSVQQLFDLASKAGFADPRTAAAVFEAESSGNPNAVNPNDPGGSYGIPQLNEKYHPGSKALLGDTDAQMRSALDISHGGTDFTPWSAYKSGAYRKFLSGLDGAQPQPDQSSPAGPLVTKANIPPHQMSPHLYWDGHMIHEGILPTDQANQPSGAAAGAGGETQVAQVGQPQDLTGGQPRPTAASTPPASAGGAEQVQLPPKPQLYNLGEVAQRLQQQVATMGGSAAFKRQFVNSGLSAAKSANEALLAGWRADVEVARFKQTQQNQQSEQAVRGMHVFRDPQGNQHWLRSGDPIPAGWKEGSGGSAFGNLSDMPSAIVLPEKLWPGAPDRPPTGLKDAAGNPVTLDPGVYSAALAYAKSGGSIKPPFSLWGNNPLALKFNQALPVAEQALGIAPSKLADVGAAYGGERAAATTVGHVTGSTAQGAQEIGMFVPLITSTAAKIDLSQFPTINTIANAVRKGTGDPNIIALNSYIQSAKNAYVLVMTRSGRPTVWANKRSDELLSPSMGVDQIPAALEAMQNEAKVAQAGARAATQEVTGQGMSVAPPGQPQGAAPAAAQPPMPNAKQAPDGNWYVPDPDRPGKYLRVDQ